MSGCPLKESINTPDALQTLCNGIRDMKMNFVGLSVLLDGLRVEQHSDYVIPTLTFYSLTESNCRPRV